MSSLLLAAVTVLSLVPYDPAVVGGWTTYLVPSRYSDLLARGDTVWCATREAGLLRYSLSGRRFSAITRSPNGLASNELSSLAYDRSGRLWVGTYGSGASRMSADGSSWLLVNPFDGLPSDTVNCMRAEGDTVWIGTPKGIAFWNGTQIAGSLPIFGQPSPFASDNITGIVVRGDSLWVSTDAGVYVSTRAGGLTVWTPVNNGLGLLQVNSLATNDTLLFCHVAAGVYAYVDGSWQFRGGMGSVVRLQDDAGQVLVTSDAGIFRVTNGDVALLNTDPLGIGFSDELSQFALTPVSGGRYVGARQNGMLVQPAPGIPSGWAEEKPNGPPGNDIRTLALDGTRVWANAFNSGIGVLGDEGWRVWPKEVTCSGAGCDSMPLNTAFPFSLLVDRTGKKWFGCWGSAVEELNDGVQPTQVRHHIINDALGAAVHTFMWVSAADSAADRGRWFGGDTPDLGVIEPIGLEYYSDSMSTDVPPVPTGVTVYRGNLRTSNNPALRMNKIHGLTVDRLGTLWVGTTGQGILRITPPPPYPAPFVPENLNIQLVLGSNSFDVQGLVARGDTIWALTTHELLRYNRRQPDNTPASYSIPEATPLFAIQPLAVGPDGSPWVGTEAGMRVFRPNGTSEDFNVSNSPIAGNQIYSIRVEPRTGVVWISTSSGMNRYDPRYVAPPPPQVEHLNVQVYPNPISLNRAGLQLRLQGNAGLYRGRILDIAGRQVATFDVPASGRVIWDGHDQEGRMVKPGIYLVHVEAGGRSATVRVAVVR